MAHKSFIRSRSRSSSSSPSTQSHSYNLRNLISLPLLQFTPTPSTRSSPSGSQASGQTSGSLSISEAPRQAKMSSRGSSRSHKKRDRSLSRMLLPTVYPTPTKRRKVDRTRPLVTFDSPKPGSQDSSERLTLPPSPSSSQSTELPEIVVGRTLVTPRRPGSAGGVGKGVGIKMPVSKSLRIRGSAERRQSVPRCGPSRPCHGSRADDNWRDSDVEIVAVTRRVPPPRPIPSQPTLKLKIPARNPTPRAATKRNQATQTEASATWSQLAGAMLPGIGGPVLHSGEGQAGFIPDDDGPGISYLGMKVLEERTNSWGQYNNAEEEMGIIVRNYLALEQELADTQEKLRLIKDHKKRHWSTALLPP